ncbi:MAG: asparagine synthase (glutamine-hydrolyzing) [Epsilonproteobacteria bacterium]|nr:asparagine synthase (glutamine-hydrolyzing) [Campylobacterota bacterium]
MCGIAGFVDFSKRSEEHILKQMTDILHHRGPDDSGYHFEGSDDLQLGLGHRRLSILDLSAHGHQPMDFEEVVIVYNGEVYNFAEIRVELERYGYCFNSHSDTEVILKAYHKWGIDAIHRFNGMFAIALYDKSQAKFYLIRDRAGVKPLFWSYQNDQVLFASELKSLHQHPDFIKEINHDAVAKFLQLQYIPEPYSIFKQCYKLRAGHILEIDLKSHHIEEKQYWDVIDCYNKPKLDISETEALHESERVLKEACELRMVSDVPVGIFLSGGYDSSTVAALLQQERTDKIKTFTIGFHENGFDEAPYAKEVASYLGTDHYEYYCTHQDASEIIPKLSMLYDEPFSDASAIPTTLVSQLARQEVTVSLSADGGDELFFGYDKYERALKYYKRFSKLPTFLKKQAGSFLELFDPQSIPYLKDTYNFTTRYNKLGNMLKSKDIIETLQYTAEYCTVHSVEKLLKYRSLDLKTNYALNYLIEEENDLINRMLAIDYKTYMVDDVLVKVDRATMSASLEGREPLLDFRLIEFLATIPSEYKYKNGVKKYLLKEITHKYIPKSMMDRPKMGFGVPIQEWFKEELKEYFLHYLDVTRLEKEDIFNTQEVIRLRDRYLSGEKDNVDLLWSILMFEMWYEKWM